MSRNWLFLSIGVAAVTGLLFAAYPGWDLHVSQCFYDPDTSNFPVASNGDWKIIRRAANWIPLFFLAPACLAILRKLVHPSRPMFMAPSAAVFLLASYLVGPGLITQMVFKDSWGRPRPYQVQDLGGTKLFEPWWRTTGTCDRNCSFVSGEASQAFWLVAPASLAPPQIRPLALGGALLFGTAVGTLRVVFGRHFLTDVVFAGLVTVVVICLFFWLLRSPGRRNDAKLENALEKAGWQTHRAAGALLSAWGGMLARNGAALRKTGRHLRGGVAKSDEPA